MTKKENFMKKSIISAVIVSAVLVSGAFASSKGVSCKEDKASWQGKDALMKKIEAEGGKAKKISVKKGCYAAQVTMNGKKHNLHFNPKTLDEVK